MPLITYCTSPILFDTLPALKATEFYHCTKEEERVYCYQKLFVQNGDFNFAFTCFEQRPAAGSRCGFIFTFEDDQVCPPLLLSAAANGTVSATQNGAPCHLPLAGKPFSGADEQGHYWGVAFTFPRTFCESIFGKTAAPGIVLLGNFVKYFETGAAICAAHPLPGGCIPTGSAGLDTFVLVPY